MLHIFNGAPILNSENVDREDAMKESRIVWKRYKFKVSDLKDNSFGSCSNEVLQFEYNDIQLSNVDVAVREMDKDEVIDYHANSDSRTTADDLYREVYVESQCLLDSEKVISNNLAAISSPQRYHDCHLKNDLDSSGYSQYENVVLNIKTKSNKSDQNKRMQYDDSYELSNDSCIEVVRDTPNDLLNEQKRCCFKEDLSIANEAYSCQICDENPNVINFTSIEDSMSNMLSGNICVVILQTFPSKKVFIKQGVNIGQTIELASIMVGDQTKFYFDITLWRECAEWVNRLFVGDIVLLTDISFQSFRKKIIGKTNKNSKVYNLHRPQYPYPDNWMSILCLKKLHLFVKWIQYNHNYLNSPALKKKLSTVMVFSEMTSEHLHDIKAKVKDISVHDEKSDLYSFLGVRLPKVILELQDQNQMLTNLYLWGDMYKEVEKMKTSIDKMIIVTAVIQKFDRNKQVYSLHTTSKSEITYADGEVDGDTIKFICTINYFQFETDSQSKVYLSSMNIQQFDDMKSILYQGCNSCYTQLYKDSNEVFVRCNRCESSKLDLCFSKFQMNIKKVNGECSNFGASDPKAGGVFGDISHSLEIIIYPDRANKVFPSFMKSKNNLNCSMDLLEVLKEEIDSLLSGKMFDFTLKKIDLNNEQFSLVNEDIFELVDMVPN